jgi:hypothetical protein
MIKENASHPSPMAEMLGFSLLPISRLGFLVGHLGRVQRDAVKARPVALVLAPIATLFEAVGEGFVAAGVLACVFRPRLPRLIQLAACRRGGVAVDIAALSDPAADRILLGEIGFTGLADDGRRGEPDPLPFEAPELWPEVGDDVTG